MAQFVEAHSLVLTPPGEPEDFLDVFVAADSVGPTTTGDPVRPGYLGSLAHAMAWTVADTLSDAREVSSGRLKADLLQRALPKGWVHTDVAGLTTGLFLASPAGLQLYLSGLASAELEPEGGRVRRVRAPGAFRARPLTPDPATGRYINLAGALREYARSAGADPRFLDLGSREPPWTADDGLVVPVEVERPTSVRVRTNGQQPGAGFAVEVAPGERPRLREVTRGRIGR